MLLALFAPLLQAQGEDLQVRAAVQSQQVYVGQQFLLQIQIEGSDQPDPVDISPLSRDFTVSEAGGGSSNSTSVSIVNGRMTQQVRRGYNLNYRLAARRPGDVVIPSLEVSAQGQSRSTQPIPLRVLPPEENSDFRFRIRLSESRAYVGQPVTLTAEWFLGRQVQEFSFVMPVLEDRRFEIVDVVPAAATQGQGTGDVIEIALGDRRAVARQGVGQLDGRQFTVLRFEKVLVPREAGSVRLPASTVSFVTPSARRTMQRGLFDDFFGGGLFSDVFGGQRQLESLAIPSNRPLLEVRDLPSSGRPPGFNGWIGSFSVQAEALPTSVRVGEPITLSLSVSGRGLRGTAVLPDLHVQPDLARDFNVPREVGAAESRDGLSVYTQTLRARHDRVVQIPPIELPYFDPVEGDYRVARTEPIAIHVEPSRIVTAEDAEGRGPAGPRQLEVESSEQGMGHNHVGRSALDPAPPALVSWMRPLGPVPVALAILLLPPLAVCGLLAMRLGGRYGQLLRVRSRSPRARWRRAVAAADSGDCSGSAVAESVLTALRDYLGRRLGKGRAESAAWSYLDVEARLREMESRGSRDSGLADPALLAQIKSVFERCEGASYAGVGTQGSEWQQQLLSDARAVVDRVEVAVR